MRVMVIVKATPESEANERAPAELQKMFEEMGRFNDELIKAGVMLAGEGLLPSKAGKRVRFSGTTRTVIDGPFVESKELVGGFWIWQVKSMAEALEWARRCPNPLNEEGELELRPIGEAEDYGEALTPELREQEERMREQIKKQHGS